MSVRLEHRPPGDDVWPCSANLVEHIADIEAGWTLHKPWKAFDEDEAERENQQEVREMLARWEAHGIHVADEKTP